MGRQRYFQMFISQGLHGPKLNLWTEHITNIINLLVISGFVSHSILERTLYDLIIKKPDAYVFTSEVNNYKKLRREAITKDVKKVMRVVSKQLPGQPNVTSHSFRIGYITQLWKDSKDIEFVRQTIRHRSLNATSGYVAQMGDEERQNRISSIY